MLTLDEARVLIEFLDRVTIKGHQERANMNLLVSKIVNKESNAESENSNEVS